VSNTAATLQFFLRAVLATLGRFSRELTRDISFLTLLAFALTLFLMSVEAIGIAIRYCRTPTTGPLVILLLDQMDMGNTIATLQLFLHAICATPRSTNKTTRDILSLTPLAFTLTLILMLVEQAGRAFSYHSTPRTGPLGILGQMGVGDRAATLHLLLVTARTTRM
jgi:hypothetical protein